MIKYKTLMKMLEAMQEEDPAIALHIEIASAVKSNIDLSPYDDEGVEELCSRIENYYNKSSKNCDIDSFAYCIQDQINNGAYESPTEDCLADAWEQAREMDAFC